MIRIEIMNIFGADDPDFNIYIKKYLINGKKCIRLGIVLTITFKEKDNAWRELKHKDRHPICIGI